METKIIQAIIVDDEMHARRSLEAMLHLYCPQVNVLAQCNNVPEAVIAINTHKPDVVFLDIEMPEYSGLELPKFFSEINFEIIFITAYNEYAVKAFELSAIDYLLKPLQPESLKNAIDKLQQKLISENLKDRLELLQENIVTGTFYKIALPVNDGLLFVELDHIIILEAHGAYTNVILNNNVPILVSKKLKFFEDNLSKRKNFFRIHRSHIINLNFVKKYNRLENFVEMDNGNIITVSKERKKEFEENLKEIRIGK